MRKFDVIVIGAGHAGLEASSAAARCGAKVALITTKFSNIGELSCNPAIGGIGKGTIVREIDALGGLMGILADKSSIHTKMLNSSKGPAVWGLRAQIDRKLYKKNAQEAIINHENIDVIEGMCDSISVNGNKFEFAVIGDEKIFAKSIVVTTGTFLNGITHCGGVTKNEGRVGELPSNNLGNCFKSLGFKMSRLKTGTPARIIKSSIDYSDLEFQSGEDPAIPFSYLHDKTFQSQISCHITYTNEKTHEIIKNAESLSPMHNGQISSRGPRYCPSIEDKIRRFSERERHQIFLEPEGLDSDLVYPNGISTALPSEIQEKFIKTIKGLENCKISQFGYAIEYDYIDPTTLTKTLSLKNFEGIFFAGQINGTTGYEEAGGQGVLAGINAGLFSLSKNEFELDRNESFIGVMVDDLTSIGVNGEPYRMFTSRAEHRLSMRHDNADFRLTKYAHDLGIIEKNRFEMFSKKIEDVKKLRHILSEKKYTPVELEKLGIKISQDGVRRSCLELLRNKSINFEKICEICNEASLFSKSVSDYVDTEEKYHFYIKRQIEENQEILKSKDIKIPIDIDYRMIQSLSNEVVEKLKLNKPKNIHEASKISGLTPAAISAIIVYLKKKWCKKLTTLYL